MIEKGGLLMNPQDFINKLAPMAVKEMKRTGILASITIAQGALESGWGSSAPGNNLFGIKGAGQLQETKEFINGHWLHVIDGFRVYDDWIGSVLDHSQFLIENGRYARAGFFERCAEKDYVGAANSLQSAGYATDPKYAEKLIAIIYRWGLNDWDRRVEDKEPNPAYGNENGGEVANKAENEAMNDEAVYDSGEGEDETVPDGCEGGVNNDYMKPEDANKIIAFLKAAYEAIDNPQSRQECHRLANELRKVSGQQRE
jgi:hypothetical protein